MSKPKNKRGAVLRRNALAVALAVGLGLSGSAVLAQSTSGQIFGNAQASQTIEVVSNTGLTRTIEVGSDGKYRLGNLPVGQYTVNAMEDGAVVSSHVVTVNPGAGTQVNFGAQQLQAIEVSASALPPIDVTNVHPSVTLNAAQLSKIPVGQGANDIALLAPGTVSGSGYFANAVSFMGAGITENAYYVNGFNTTSLYDYTGSSYDLPYGAIARQENLVGGFGAKYGRSDGGVINQVGKRGSNQWHFGGRIQWVPRSLRADPVSQHYPDVQLTGDEKFSDQKVSAGDLYRDRSHNKSWNYQYSAYVGGPIVEDKLFLFVDAETSKTRARSVGTVSGQTDIYYGNHSNSWYGKLDWNISDNNILEYTYLKQDERNGYGETFRYDPDTGEDLFSLGPRSWDEYHYKSQIVHYTGYLTDKATLEVLYGKSDVRNPQLVPDASPLPYVAGASAQDPSITGGATLVSPQTATQINSPNRGQKSHGLRVDFSYQLGNHNLSAGIDNLYYEAKNVGVRYSGPGYVWIYGLQSDPDAAISTESDVGAPGGNGYFVKKTQYTTLSGMSARQKAWYVQDNWQVTPNILVNLGLRNDGFTNYNPDGVPFVDLDNQWEPRVGFSWDVNGDSSLKVYANFGRYYLALPQAAANRSATASTYITNYYTYTGIDSDGIPTGLEPVPNVEGTGPSPDVSKNNEFGELPNPKLVAATNLKSQYQDEIIFGFDKTLGSEWTYGAKFTYRVLQSMIDDGCSYDQIAAAVQSQGFSLDEYDAAAVSCHAFNPGGTNDYLVPSTSGGDPITVSITQAEAGFPDPQREYYGLNLHLEHPFNGTWFGRVDYTFSRNWGNSEGQVRSDIGQGDISQTEDWDYPELMDGSRGYLANDRRHQIKAYGAWAITPEWLLSGVLKVQSGGPISCLGFYGPTPEDPATNNPGMAYGSDYHWCEGEIWTPGQERTPWTKQLNLGVSYIPSWADGNLAFKAYVFNVTDSQKPVQLQSHRFDRAARTVRNDYHMPVFFQSPRYVRFTITYDY